MRFATRLFLRVALCTFAGVHCAHAQTPDTGLIGAGGDIGVLFPASAFEKTLTLDAFGEYYVTPRVSVRALLAWANPGFDNRTEDKFRQTKLLFNGVYNWELVEWHPFVTAGAGAYFVRQLLDGRNDPDGETRGGINLGGGVEYFTGSMSSIKAEGRWDIVSHPPGLPDASGFSLTIGFKRYF
jgi:hypothetical protein